MTVNYRLNLKLLSCSTLFNLWGILYNSNTTSFYITNGWPKCRFLFWYYLAIKRSNFNNLSMVLQINSATSIYKIWKWNQFKRQVTNFLLFNKSKSAIRSVIILSYFSKFFHKYRNDLSIYLHLIRDLIVLVYA